VSTTPTTTPTPEIPGVDRRHTFRDLYHERTNYQFIKHTRRWFILSAAMILISLLAFVVRDLNLGIDFEGGTAWIVEVGDGVDPSVSEVRDLLEPLGFADSKISILSGTGNDQIRVQAEVLEDPIQELQRAVAVATGTELADVQYDRTGDGGATLVVALPADSEATADEITAALVEAGHPDAETTIGADQRAVVVLGDVPDTPLQQVANALAEYAGVEVDAVSISTVGPTWGERVTRKAIQATLVFFLLLAVYLSFRFQWKMAFSSIAAVLHDIVISIGVYALFQFEVTPATVTAFLTILGFSLYDTVVVFDKITENERTLLATGRATYPEMVNTSLNNVLMRSLSTSLVALLPVVSLLVVGSWIMGATALEEFAIALAVGLAIGAYSSIFVAAPLLAWWKNREPRFAALQDRRQRTTLAASSAATGVPVVDVDDVIEEERPDKWGGVPGPPAVPRSTTPRPRQQRRRKRK